MECYRMKENIMSTIVGDLSGMDIIINHHTQVVNSPVTKVPLDFHVIHPIMIRTFDKKKKKKRKYEIEKKIK